VTPDVNVLVAADRGEHVHHDVAVRWIEAAVSAASRAAPLTLLPTVIVGYVRVVTDQRVFRAEATSLDHALANVSGLLAAPNVRLADCAGELPLLAELCRTHRITGPGVTDAWVAASVLHLGERLLTFDRGFRRLLPPRHLTMLKVPA